MLKCFTVIITNLPEATRDAIGRRVLRKVVECEEVEEEVASAQKAHGRSNAPTTELRHLSVQFGVKYFVMFFA